MDTTHEDGFVVYVRNDRGRQGSPDSIEQPLQVCSSYAEARQLQRAVLGSHPECVIRFLGPSGGGD